MSLKNAQVSNWVAERAEATASTFDLNGSTESYTSFSRAFSAGDTVFYSAHDEQGNREAGYGVFNGSTEITRNPTATLVNRVYNSSSPSKVSFTGEITVACTFNASAFNALWKALDAIDPDGDGGINIPPELIEGLVDTLNSKAEQADLEKEIADRKAGDQDLQDQIDALDPDGDRKVDWAEIEGKPTEFPPAAHNQDWNTITNTPSEYPPEAHNHDGVYAPVVHGHEIDEINGLQDALDSAGGTPAWGDITGKPAEFPPEDHTHQQGDVDGLEDRLTSIEGSISSGGGFVDAPPDGKLYGRQSEAWAEVVVPDAADPDWGDIQNKPTEFPPSAHNHDGVYAPVAHGHEIDEVNGLQDALDAAGGTPAWDDVTGKPTEFPPAAHNQGWDTITGKPSEYPPSSHGHEIDDVNGLQDALDAAGGTPAWDDVTGKPSEYPPEAHTHEQSEVDGLELRLEAIEGSITDGGGFVDAPDDGKLYGRQSEAWAEVVIPDGGASSWDEIADKPTEFPPEDHTHVVADITDFDPADYQPAGDYIEDADSDGKQYARKDGAWSEITSTGGGSSLWEQNGSDIYYDTGNVGIDTNNPWGGKLHVAGNIYVEGRGESSAIELADWKVYNGDVSDGQAFHVASRTSGNFFTIDSSGNVGIGMTPATRTAKEQLAEWKAKFDARLKAEPKADKKAITLEITDDAFEVLPTEEALAEWMETRAAGDKLQVNGNISATGTVTANGVVLDRGIYRPVASGAGIRLSNKNSILPTDNTGTQQNDLIGIGDAGNKFKDAYFSGTVYADKFEGTDGHFSGAVNFGGNAGGIRYATDVLNASGVIFENASGPSGVILTNNGQNFDPTSDGQVSLGHSDRRWKDGKFSGTVDAAGFTVNGSPIGGGSGGLPDGGYTYGWNITAADFIATSDERVKDNITTAPVGLIDSLKGREWEWKESGEKGSGVVAQELEEVLPHLVHTDDEGMKSVAYNGLVAYLIEELKDCRQRIADLEAKS